MISSGQDDPKEYVGRIGWAMAYNLMGLLALEKANKETKAQQASPSVAP